MDLKNKYFSIFALSISFILIVVLSFIVSGKCILSKNNIITSFNNFKYVDYIKDNDEIKDLLNSYKLPNKVFDYFDENEIKGFVNDSIDNLYGNSSYIIKEDVINYYLINVINKYDEEHLSSVSQNIAKDIEKYSKNVANELNDSNNMNTFRWLYSIGNDVLFYTVSIMFIILVVLLIIIEKRNGFLFASILSFICSIVMYYVNNNYINIFFKDINIFKYVTIFKGNIKNICVIIFVLSLVLFAIYVIYLLKRLFYKIRLHSYDNNFWR